MPISRCDRAGFRLLLGLALLVVGWLALTPQPVEVPSVAMGDKWSHLLAFVMLAFLVDASWPGQGFDWRKWLPLFAYGVLIELLQTQIPNRTFELADIVADALGIALYGSVVLRLLRAGGYR